MVDGRWSMVDGRWWMVDGGKKGFLILQRLCCEERMDCHQKGFLILLTISKMDAVHCDGQMVDGGWWIMDGGGGGWWTVEKKVRRFCSIFFR